MKKSMMLAAMLALLVLALAVPAIAQVANGVGNENQSGDVSATFSVTSTGDNGSQCATPLQFGNTGSNQNAQSFLQYASTPDEDLEAQGVTLEFAPVLNAPCGTPVQQSSAANGQ